MSAPTLTWSCDLDEEAVRAIRDLLAQAQRADGVEPVGEQVLHSLGETAGRGGAAHLRAVVDGVTVGYANLVRAPGEPPVGELAVHPEHRRRGYGAALLSAVRERGGPGTRVWAHGDGTPAQSLAAAVGLVGVRDLLQMRLDLRAVELPELPDRPDVAVHTYRGPVDDEAVLAVNNAAFSWHPEQGGWGPEEMAQRRAEPWFDPAGFFLAVDSGGSGELLGFHWTKVHAGTDTEPAVGEVYVVAIDPGAQGRGLGRLLTLAGLHHLRDAGLGSVLLYVEGDNDAALHTYQRLGFTVFHLDRAYGDRAS
ncbi:MAG: mycothiol synthase [Mycobacteriaceae bacterium]